MSTKKIMSPDDDDYAERFIAEAKAKAEKRRRKQDANLTAEQLRARKESEECFDRNQMNDAVKRWEPSPEIARKIAQICGTDESFETSLRRAYWYSARHPDQQFQCILYLHDDLAGKFSKLVKNLQYDLPDLSVLPNGRYRLVLKYYDWYLKLKGGGMGGIATKWRDITIERDAAEGGEVRGQQTPKPDEYREILAEIDKQYKEAMNFHFETIRARKAIEEEAYNRGVADGRRMAALENLPPAPQEDRFEMLLSRLLEDKLKMS